MFWKYAANLCNYFGTLLKSHFECSPVNFLHIFRTPFPRNTSGRLLLRAKNFIQFFCELKKFSLVENTQHHLKLRGWDYFTPNHLQHFKQTANSLLHSIWHEILLTWEYLVKKNTWNIMCLSERPVKLKLYYLINEIT